MQRRIIQDIQPSERIRKKIQVRDPLPLPKQFERQEQTKEEIKTNIKTENFSRPPVKDTTPLFESSRIKIPSFEYEKPNKKKWRTLVIIFTIFLILGIVIATFVFHKATISITPTQVQIAEGEFGLIAYKNPKDETMLQFQTASLRESVSEEVPVSAEEEVETKASGTIVIYNKHSTTPQKLLEETRFETPDGKVYKLGKGAGLVIPGMKKQGNETIPGSIEAVVYAENPGEEYNIGLTDFTVPGFKGSAKYQNFYARSKTPMTGGFVGVQSSVSQEVIAEVITRLEPVMREKLDHVLLASIGESFVVFPDSKKIIIEEPIIETIDDKKAKLIIHGSLRAILFRKNDLSFHIAQKAIKDFSGDPVSIAHFENLDFVTKEDIFTDPQSLSTINFSIQGTPLIVWTIDTEGITNALLGRTRKIFQETLRDFSGIERAEVSFSPFWRKSFPTKTESIKIVLPEN